jgi:hypothetical protein
LHSLRGVSDTDRLTTRLERYRRIGLPG